MTTGALIFMIASWTLVLGLTFWSFYRLMRSGNSTAAAEQAGHGTGPLVDEQRTS